MSGKNCFSVLEKIFVQNSKKDIENIKGYTIKYGHIVNPKDNQIVDEVLVSYFKEPHSYTTENMCEINSHGGTIVVKKILELCLENGARLAEPGEFTKKAFLNGRIDLSQAEAVIDIINAKTEGESKASIKQLEGAISNSIAQIRQEILNIMSDIEATIDYPEYDLEEVTNDKIKKILNIVFDKLNSLKNNFDNGKIIKEGIKTAIIGRPNAGKSSLLNCILKEERAIVTEFEGTTRDTIEEFVSIGGVPLKIIDTAGIREATDEVEKIGVTKAKKIAKEADLVIAIFDSTKELTSEDLEILNLIKNKKTIILLNKNDLESKIDENNKELKRTSKNILKVSAINNDGIDDLYEKIIEMFNLSEINFDNDVLITNARHKNLINEAILNVNKALEIMELNMPIDIVAISLKDVLEALGNITGENATEDIINEIFSKFCLGK